VCDKKKESEKSRQRKKNEKRKKKRNFCLKSSDIPGVVETRAKIEFFYIISLFQAE